MEMMLHLDKRVFYIVKNGVKDVEVRVNDSKRQKLKVGDKLIFINKEDESDRIEVVVKKLFYFINFVEVAKNYDMKRIYLEDATVDEYLKLMSKFYSDEEVRKNGVVAIEFTKEN